MKPYGVGLFIFGFLLISFSSNYKIHMTLTVNHLNLLGGVVLVPAYFFFSINQLIN